MKLRNALTAGFLLAAITGGISRPARALVNHVNAADQASSPIAVQRASNLLVHVHSLAERLKREAATLESLNRANNSRRSQAYVLHDLRSGIGSLGKMLGQLHEIRHEVEPWQQQAIDRITPAAEALALRTQAATDYVKGNRGRLSAQSYREDIHTIAQTATELHDSVSAYLAHAEGQQRLHRLMKSVDEIND